MLIFNVKYVRSLGQRYECVHMKEFRESKRSVFFFVTFVVEQLSRQRALVPGSRAPPTPAEQEPEDGRTELLPSALKVRPAGASLLRTAPKEPASNF